MLLSILSLLALVSGETSAQTIAALTEEVHVLEGDNVTLSCNYSTTTDALQWYRQFPRSRPEFLLYIYPHGTKSDPLPPRMSAERVDLIISSAAVSDSALYYCALQPTVTGNPATLYKNLPL
uniref:Ig-like domain-containing protein n=1 Tax=Pygocentrus nattereri TaxID=42514 RepID=A0AAR2M6E4_PYGNA